MISRVDEPTQWCAAMVVVPKRNSETVHICVDFRPLNEYVLREVHPLPKVEETLAQLNGTTVFSKVDANCGFWEIPLAKHSRHYTTFVTPFGRFCFDKLPFGISSANPLDGNGSNSEIIALLKFFLNRVSVILQNRMSNSTKYVPVLWNTSK